MAAGSTHEPSVFAFRPVYHMLETVLSSGSFLVMGSSFEIYTTVRSLEHPSWLSSVVVLMQVLEVSAVDVFVGEKITAAARVPM